MDKPFPKVPPNSKESEMMVLGCMLTCINSLQIGSEALDEPDFYFNEHKIIFRSLKDVYRNGKPADIHIISEDLKMKNKLQFIEGGYLYLAELAQYAGTSVYIDEYVEIVKNKALLRRIILVAQEFEKQALDNPPDANNLLMSLQNELKYIEKSGTTNKTIDVQFLNEFDVDFLTVEPPKKPMLLEYAPPGISVKGFLPKGVVAMIAGAGGVGKTHLLAQLAISIAAGQPFLDICQTTEHCGEGKKGNVFFGVGENQYDDIHRVLYKASKLIRYNQSLLKETSKRIAPYSFCGQQSSFIVDGKPSKFFREFKMRLEDSAPTGGWSLIILDPVSRFLGAEAEIDNAAATQFIALMEELTIDLPGNPTVLIVHHVNKNSLSSEKDQDQTSARGASGLTDGVRIQFVFYKSKDPEVAVLKMTKSNFTAIIDNINTKKDIDGFIKYEPSTITAHKPEDQQKSNKKQNNSFLAQACKDV